MIVLGCWLNADKTVGNPLESRANKALELYESGIASKILLTGGDGESEALRKFFVSKGVENDFLLLETSSTTTNENAQFSANLIGHQGLRLAIVTDSYHVFRSELLFQKHFPDCFIQPFVSYSKTTWRLYGSLRECFALIKNVLFGKIDIRKIFDKIRNEFI